MKKLKYLTLALAGCMLALTNLHAADETAKKAGKDDGFVGVVTKIDTAAKKLTVKNPKENKEVTYTFSEDTDVVDEGGKDIEITTIKEGVRVRVRADESGTAAKRIKVTDKQKGEKKKDDKKKDAKE